MRTLGKLMSGSIAGTLARHRYLGRGYAARGSTSIIEHCGCGWSGADHDLHQALEIGDLIDSWGDP